jgi:hypothetical protein
MHGIETSAVQASHHNFFIFHFFPHLLLLRDQIKENQPNEDIFSFVDILYASSIVDTKIIPSPSFPL